MMDHVSHLNIETEGSAMLVLAGVEMMQRRKDHWSERELAVLREHYPTGGASKCAEYLPSRTLGAIGWRARTMRLPKPPFKKHAPAFTSTPHIDATIKRFYQLNPKKGGLSKLAHQIGRPVAWCSRRAGDLGIQRPRFPSVEWTEREIELLRVNAWRTPGAIARILRRHGFHRSPNAVNLKLCRLRCDRTSDDMYTAFGLAELFGVDKSVVTAWIRKGWLKANKRGSEHPQASYAIHHRDVRRFVIENAGAIDIRCVEKHWFIDLLAGHK